MDKILVVEDEKMIRQGIVAMVKRIPIPIESVVECRNGEDAYELLQKETFDLMLTDIRMPKMDGITLVKKIRDMENRPKIVVISGYDDFNYAVEALRQGVNDYLLKPIEREKLSAVLINLEEEIKKDKEFKSMNRKIGNARLRYVLLNHKSEEVEIEAIDDQLSELLNDHRYVMCCFPKVTDEAWREGQGIFLEDIHGQDLLILSVDQLPDFLGNSDFHKGIGISGEHQGINELQKAFTEAYLARKESFIKNEPYVRYEVKHRNYETIPSGFVPQFTQLFGTAKVDEALTKYSGICHKAKMGKIDSEDLLITIDEIMDHLLEMYGRIVEIERADFEGLREPLKFMSIAQYSIELEKWLRKIQQAILNEFDDYKNKEKINHALQYIHNHYNNDLNMAVVSNHISMNYSLFSLSFKQYTGMNFVNYLKKLRMEEAKRMLEETDEKIIAISQRVGYENEKHFMKTFKSMYGVSPGEYRKNKWLGKTK